MGIFRESVPDWDRSAYGQGVLNGSIDPDGRGEGYGCPAEPSNPPGTRKPGLLDFFIERTSNRTVQEQIDSGVVPPTPDHAAQGQDNQIGGVLGWFLERK